MTLTIDHKLIIRMEPQIDYIFKIDYIYKFVIGSSLFLSSCIFKERPNFRCACIVDSEMPQVIPFQPLETGLLLPVRVNLKLFGVLAQLRDGFNITILCGIVHVFSAVALHWQLSSFA